MSLTSNPTLENISFYLPSLTQIILPSDPVWIKINDLFSKKLDKRTREAGEGTITIEASVYDIIVAVKKGNSQALRLLDFFDKLTTELFLRLEKDGINMIVKNVQDLLLNFDHKYLNFVGELAVLNNVLKSGMYILAGVEASVVNSAKTIDFKLLTTNEGKYILVEVLNMHLDEYKIENEKEKIQTLLTDRLTKKIASKATSDQFYLVPVIWSSAAALKIYSEYFKTNKMHIQNVVEPVAYLTFIDPQDENFLLHKFGNVSGLFD